MNTYSTRRLVLSLAAAGLLHAPFRGWSQEEGGLPETVVEALVAEAAAPEAEAPTRDAPAAEKPAEVRPFAPPPPPAALPDAPPPVPAGKILLNFRGAPVDAVLDHLSQAAGFIIVKDAPVSGSVDVWSHQPLAPDEAVELLNTVLARQGLAAVRTGRVLRIVSRSAALAADLPVAAGADPETIDRSDSMATQIIPVKYADAAKLVENLRPLLGEGSQLSANASSNSLILTDTRTNIRRMALIVRALDTSISNITEIRAFPLEHAEATELAEVVNKVFAKPDQNQNTNRGGPMEFIARMRRGGPPGMPGGEQGETGTSEAKLATASVTAVGDERSNTLVVSASDELMPQVAALVKQVDVPTEDTAVVEVFFLRYADAEEVAEILDEVYGTGTTSSNQNNTAQRPFGMFGGRMMPGGPQQQQSSASRSLGEAEVRVVADTRTNALVVSASPATLASVGKVIEKLDETPKNVNQIYIYRIENADLENLQTILQGLFDDIEDTGTTTTLAPTGGTRTGTAAGTGTVRTRN
ncbi:MAG: secretin N-terminal domain-containing protein [Lentisphaeria bacterium]|jgi:general secretion pathway protein D|nr:secretin N-terminal domain-containing protein [Lentisphaeria bacterium]